MQAQTFFLVLGAAALTTAQNITTVPANVTALADTIPLCAAGCLTDAAALAGCGATDYTCECAHYAAIQASSSSCLNTRCSAADIASMWHTGIQTKQ